MSGCTVALLCCCTAALLQRPLPRCRRVAARYLAVPGADWPQIRTIGDCACARALFCSVALRQPPAGAVTAALRTVRSALCTTHSGLGGPSPAGASAYRAAQRQPPRQPRGAMTPATPHGRCVFTDVRDVLPSVHRVRTETHARTPRRTPQCRCAAVTAAALLRCCALPVVSGPRSVRCYNADRPATCCLFPFPHSLIH